jgi:tRNA pseudouridine32 synthase / 23S rRNA pseudouridine746 synthase
VSPPPDPARVYLAKLRHPPATIFDFLAARFAHIAPETWQDRIRRGLVTTDQGKAITAHTPYQHGLTIFYHRERAGEPILPFSESILFEDEHLLVADKPHFLPVTPAGGAVQECLLARLQRDGARRHLVPVHRLDRDTAGVVVFSKIPSERPLYASLFASQQVRRSYRAIARAEGVDAPQRWTVEDRLEPEPGSFRMRSVAGIANSRTEVVLAEVRGGLGRFELIPHTGKKHQLRIHMMRIGFPILNDSMYPEQMRPDPQDYSRPLQLLAVQLEFSCPVTGRIQCFRSGRTLSEWPQ